jgi:rare lipoprotein A (peptidoglycan hydrolase)
MVTTGIAAAAGGTVSGSDAGTGSDVKVHVKRHARVGNQVKISGRVTPADSRQVSIMVDGKRVETVRSDDEGDFSVRWNPGSSGIYTVRAVAQDDQRATASRSNREQLNVYRPAQASYYGPGLYGNATACGGRLTPSTQGVAHKTLPCGTKVTLRYRGRTVTVPVIDRGPYAGNREYDLTAATKAKLGFGSTGAVLTTR